MLVLLHFYRLGYTPFTLAFLFLLYETAGIFANLGGGWLRRRASAFPRMLAIGQTLADRGLADAVGARSGLGRSASVAWVVIAQGIAGVAKDLTKTASKSAIKATSAEGGGQLFQWVAWFTGSKNAMKGIGFFVGGLLLESGRIHARAVADGRAARRHLRRRLVAAAAPARQGESVENHPRAVRQDRAASICWRRHASSCSARATSGSSLACRCFSTRTVGSFMQVAGFLAAWTIAYGGVQAIAPSLVTRSADGL